MNLLVDLFLFLLDDYNLENWKIDELTFPMKCNNFII